MIIGQDFEKMRFSAFGLDLLEPNAIIGDLLIFFLSLFFAFKVYPLISTKKFYKYWFYFFIVFGFGFLLGGLGHLFFNYWGIPGKYAGWYFSVFSVFFAEQAMLDAWQNLKLKALFQKISVVKLFIVLIAMFLFYNYSNLEADEQRGLLIPAANSFVGLFSTVGILSWQLQTKVHNNTRIIKILKLHRLNKIGHIFLGELGKLRNKPIRTRNNKWNSIFATNKSIKHHSKTNFMTVFSFVFNGITNDTSIEVA